MRVARACWVTKPISQPNQTLSKTKQIHALLVTTPLLLFDRSFLTTKLIRFYAINNDLVSAHLVFHHAPHRTIYVWNSIIRAYALKHHFHQAFSLYSLLNQQHTSKTQPDNFTFACIFRACSDKSDLNATKLTHKALILAGLESDHISGSALVSAYSKLGLINYARKVFDKMPEPDLVLWNSMISGYGHGGFWEKSIGFFNQMVGFGIKPDGFTLVGLVSCLSSRNLAKIGSLVHGFGLKNGLDSNSHLKTGLVSMYSRCGCFDSAYRVFSSLSDPDLITWSALIAGVLSSGDCKKALVLFKETTFTGKKPDAILISSVLAACARSTMVGSGKEIHGCVFRRGFELEVVVSSALIDMYAKCGFAEMALRVFETIPAKNVVAYNSIISGLGLHGFGLRVIDIFEEMLEEGLKPDEATFSALLCSCCHSGLLENSQIIFERMEKEFGIKPRTEHYVYIVHLLGLAGKLEEAYMIVQSMPELPDAGVLGALLSGCGIHGNSKLGDIVARELFQIEPDKTAYKVMLSNIYAADGRWDDVKKLRDEMVGKGLKKNPGLSWVGVQDL